MNESIRWKEYRVRQEIYKQHLKETGTVPHEVEFDNSGPEAVSDVSISFFEQMFGTRWDERLELRANT